LLSFICCDVYQCIIVLTVFTFYAWGTGNHLSHLKRCAWIEIQQSLWQDKTLGSVVYAPMHLIMEYMCVPYAWHAWLQQPHLWVCSQTFCSPRWRIHSPREKLFLEFMVYFSLLICDLSGIFSMGLVVLVSF
jgi:hypothetical protein